MSAKYPRTTVGTRSTDYYKKLISFGRPSLATCYLCLHAFSARMLFFAPVNFFPRVEVSQTREDPKNSIRLANSHKFGACLPGPPAPSLWKTQVRCCMCSLYLTSTKHGR